MIHWQGIYGVVLRYWFLYTRNGLRAFELFFWPLNNLLVWGFVTRYLSHAGAGNAGIPISFLLGGMLLWDVQFRATQGVSISLLEDIWVRNLLNVFVAPIRTYELVIGYCLVGVIRLVITLPVLVAGAFLMFQFNLLDFDVWLVPFFANLLLFGWGLGLFANAMILRWGQGAESLCWALPFMVQPFSAVFYTVETLPGWLQPLAWLMPVSHVFEGMRAALSGRTDLGPGLALAFGLNVLWIIAAGVILQKVLTVARSKGLITKVGTQ